MFAEQDIRAISYLKAHTADVVSQVNNTHRPLYVTRNGKPKAVLLDTKSYEDLLSAANLMRLVAQGEDGINNKKPMEQNKFFAEFEKKHFKKK